jgi:hypothetical protein
MSDNKEVQKENKEENKVKEEKKREKNKQQCKEYYHNNKEKIRAKMREWCICEICGTRLKKGNKWKHQKTNRCKEIAEFVNNSKTEK